MERVYFPMISDQTLHVGQQILICGHIFCGRDAVLPRLVECIQNGTLADMGLDLNGAVIFHSAVSDAGVGPTSSNKFDIESSIPALSQAGVKLHLGKGKLSPEVVKKMKNAGASFGVTPPVTALFDHCIRSSKVVAFPELGMEALYELEVEDVPAIIVESAN